MQTDIKQFFQAALEIQGFFEQQNLQFMFIGGLANLRWGQQRTTENVDGMLLTFFTDEERIVKSMLERFASRISDAETLALKHRVLLLKASNGIGLDIALGGLPFEQRMVERSSLFTFEENVVLRTCSAEDLVVLKAFAAKDDDWAGVGAILERQKGKLDITSILENLHTISEIKGDPEVMVRIKVMI